MDSKPITLSVAFGRLARRMFAVAAIGSAVAGLGVGCTHDNPSSISVPLTYKPKNSLNTNAAAGQVAGMKVFVAPVVDDRSPAQKDKIGENVEDSDTPPIPVMPDGEVSAFLHQVLADQLAVAGLTIVTSQAEADRILQPTLNQFWVEEGGTYKGTVSATFTMNSKSGAKLWGPGKFTGAYTHFGKSKSAGNYQEAFSESSRQIVEELLSNAGFRTSLQNVAAVPAVPAPGVTTVTPKAATTPKANPLTRKPAPPVEPAAPEEPAPAVEEPATPAKVKPAPAPKDPAPDAKDAAEDAKDATKAAAEDAAKEAKEAAGDNK